MIAAFGALALLSITYTGPLQGIQGLQPLEAVQPMVSDPQVMPPGSPSVLVVLVNADGSPAGELRSSKVPTLVELQMFEGNTQTDSQMIVKPEEKPLAQSYVWMQKLALRMLDRTFNFKSRSHPCSTVTDIDTIVIIREVSDEEAASTEPIEQRAERTITGILGG